MPIFCFLIVIFVIALGITNQIVSVIEKENIRLLQEKHTFGIKKIIDRAITEITTSQMLKYDVPMFMEIKQKDVIEDIKTYWQKNNLEGAIVVNTNGSPDIIFSSLKNVSYDLIKSHNDKEYTLINKKFFLITIKFPLWDWSIYTVSDSITFSETIKYINYIIPINFVGAFLSLLVLWFVFNRNVARPLKEIKEAVKKEETIKKTNINEMDVLVNTINKSFNDLRTKNQHTKILHDTVIELQKYNTTYQIMEYTATIGRDIFDVDTCVLVTIDKDNKITNLILKSGYITERESANIVSSLNKDMPFHTKPVIINSKDDIAQLIEDQQILDKTFNLSAFPYKLKSNDCTLIFYFLNKNDGFTDYDVALMNIFTSDVTLILETAQNIAKLKRFQKVIDSSFDSIIITNSNGEITYVNPTFELTTGYKMDEVIGKNPSILKSNYHKQAFYNELWQKLKSGQVWKGEFINKKKTGELFNESAVIFPIYFEDEVNYVAIKRDITHEKKLYEQLIRSQKMEAIGTLAGGIAHDFNNILTAILGYSELILNSINPNDKFFKPTKIINESAKKAGELTKKILTITRKEKLEAQAVQINDIIKDVIDLISHSIPKSIEIVSHLSGDIPITYADPTQIHQVILNLSVNARDAMPEGGTLTISTALVGSSNGSAIDLADLKDEFIKITVSDTGIGMDADIQQKVFDPFFTTKDKGKGSGLGLFIVHSIITNHNGYINLYSEPNKGTRFNIYLPINKASQQSSDENNSILKGTGTLLLIDDEEDVRSVCKDILNSFGFDVITAIDGKEGIQKYIEHRDKIRAVILDMIMPRMGGNEVFQTLKEINPSVKVIISSGFSQEGYAGIDKLIKDGALGFIQKPFTLQTIKNILKQI